MKDNHYLILVVEPDDQWFSKLKNTLNKQDFKVVRIKSSSEVLSACKKKDPDLVIIEHELDDSDGIEVTLELHENPTTKRMPILFFSETSDVYTKIAAFEAGADQFIKKGSKGKLIGAQIKSLLRRAYEFDDKLSEVREYGSIRIDEDAVSITKNGSAIKLSKKEFDLLLLLTSKPGKVFRRASILKKIWGDNIIVGDRNIDTHIKKLRKKLGKEHIQTSRGIGYKFNFKDS